MKERPILFSGPMVRAILNGRKTQTRRVARDVAGTGGFVKQLDVCLYGVPGDRLWVRESFQPLLADGVGWNDADYSTGEGYAINYVATSGVAEFIDQARDESMSDRITPSIFMPRWASRITLEITDVRVQRLTELSESDALAEGVLPTDTCSAVGTFMLLWDRINAKRAAWKTNPWVWCLEFRRACD